MKDGGSMKLTLKELAKISGYSPSTISRVLSNQGGVKEETRKEIEKLYPNTKTWETCTPYFDVRNIHFYVNKLKFHIVEFYNYKNPDPNSPNDYIGEIGEGMFRFIKYM